MFLINILVWCDLEYIFINWFNGYVFVLNMNMYDYEKERKIKIMMNKLLKMNILYFYFV